MEQSTTRISREQAAASLDLYKPPALHGEEPPAIDRAAVLADWRRVWRSVLRELTPIQRKALELELGSADS